MTGQHILYIGSGTASDAFLIDLAAEAEALTRTNDLGAVADLMAAADMILLDVGPDTAAPGPILVDVVHALRDRPVVALCDAAHEHRGIAAVRAGAQSLLKIDQASEREVRETLDRADARFELQRGLAGADANVLSILDNINDGAIVVDQTGRVLDVNPAARALLGLGPRETPDTQWSLSFCALDEQGTPFPQVRDLPLQRARLGHKFTDLIATYRAPDQPDTLLSLNGHGLFGARRELIGGIVTFRDITDARQQRLRLQKRSQYDELTSLPSPGLFVEHLMRAIGRAERKSTPLAVLCINLDRFRSINETLGHDAGDRLLLDVAGRLRGCLRIGDYCARWAGDEFVVCLEDFGRSSNSAAAAQKILLALSERYDLGGGEAFITPSIGIATYPEAGNDAERLIKAADVAMHEAKKRGGGRFQFFSNAMNSHLEQREELEVGLRHALVRKEFMLHYQPRVDLVSGRLIGFEALLRWQHPQYGLLSPDRFLHILEGSGLIHSAGNWTIETATRQLAMWQRQFEMPDLTVSVNLSNQQLRHERLIATVEKALADTAVDPGCVELEVSNSKIVRDRNAEQETLQALRKLGVRLSLDRFGTSEMSFESLENCTIDTFVLDRTLLTDIGANDSHQRIVRAAVAMAQGLDIEVAAGGVETLEQLDFLKSCQCNSVQGYLISQPMKPEKIAQLLRAQIAGGRLLA